MLTVTDYAPICTERTQEQSASPVLKSIAEKIGEKRFDLWFGQDTQCVETAEKVTFYVRNNFAINSIRRHCQQEIDQVILELFGQKLPVAFFVKPPQKVEPQKLEPSIPKPIQETHTSPLGTLFKNLDQGKDKAEERIGRRFATLETFIKGISNQLACSAIDMAVLHPGTINPIYIFGPTSVGKTHILEGIWSAIRKSSSRRLPLYMTAEQFMSSFIETIRSGSPQDRNQSFRSKFKGISHLLLDDIQFFARAEATQTEFMQVFDTLRNQNVQLVFTGDRPIVDLPLRSELICRLESGMLCELNLPERELSLQICESMAKQRELPLEDGVSRLIASRFGVHGRQIQGALNRLHLVYLTEGKPVTVAMAEEALGDLLRLNRRDIRLADISKIVCETFGISEDTLRSKGRSREIVTPRRLAMWLARKYTRSALSEIGLYFGNHAHSSVIAAQRRIDEQIGVDATVAEMVQKIERVLG